MSSSMLDQLLKAGLVKEDKLKAVEKEKKKKHHLAYTQKAVKEELEAEKKKKQEELMAFDKAKRELDLEKNRQIQAEKDKKAARIEARRLIDEKRQNDINAEERFNFSSDGKKIRYVRVTSAQKQQLGRGELGICRNDRDGMDYPILPREAMLRLLEIEKIEGGRWVYLLNDPNEVAPVDDEWESAWAEFEKSK